MGRYVVDFLCESRRLIIEVDGGSHSESFRYDAHRSAWLESLGYRVVRFWNNDVMSNMEGVIAVVEGALRHPLPGPPPRGRER